MESGGLLPLPGHFIGWLAGSSIKQALALAGDQTWSWLLETQKRMEPDRISWASCCRKGGREQGKAMNGKER